MNKNKKTILYFSLFMIIIIGIIYGIGINLEDDSGNYTNDDNGYNWESDQNRLNLAEKARNLTLIVNYNNETMDIFENINLNEHYTSVFDLLSNCCNVGYDIFDLGNGGSLFYITSINGLKESQSENMYWLYYVNEEYANVASNAYQLQDNDIVLWDYSHPLTESS